MGRRWLLIVALGAVAVRIAVNPTGTRLVGVGNFTTVDGQPRWRALMATLGTTAATVNPWQYPPLQQRCDDPAHPTACATSTSPPTAPTS
jgi:hypothetical protein